MTATDIKITRVKDILTIVNHWEFFLRGLAKMNAITKAERQVTPENYFKVLCDTIASGLDKGQVVMYFAGSTPVGYSVAFDNSIKYGPSSVLVYAAYSETSFKGLSKIALRHIEGWAKKQGYKEIQSFSPRFSGAGFYLFERVFGFIRQAVFFTKTL